MCIWAAIVSDCQSLPIWLTQSLFSTFLLSFYPLFGWWFQPGPVLTDFFGNHKSNLTLNWRTMLFLDYVSSLFPFPEKVDIVKKALHGEHQTGQFFSDWNMLNDAFQRKYVEWWQTWRRLTLSRKPSSPRWVTMPTWAAGVWSRPRFNLMDTFFARERIYFTKSVFGQKSKIEMKCLTKVLF